MFKLWCERGIRQFKNVKALVSEELPDGSLGLMMIMILDYLS